MAGGIKGITVKIGGDTTELGKSLTEASKQSTALQKELKGVNSLLKLDPTNFSLLQQKSELLSSAIGETKNKLSSLNEVMSKVKSGEIEMTESEFRNLEREIASTQIKLKELKDEAKDFGSAFAQEIALAGEKVKGVGENISGVGEKLLPVTGAIVGLGTAAVKTASDFDSAMSNVAAISGATGEDIQSLRDKAREMGAQTKFSATEAADAMSYMAMAGWKTGEMIDGIAGVMALASATGTDLATTSDILTDGLTAFGLTAQDAGKMADIMASASSNANTNVLLLGESYKYCASTAGAMGYSLEDITESLGLMANAGVKGSQAGTTLKNAMINLAKPTDAMSVAMDKYNISLVDSDGAMKSWNQIVDDLRVNLGGLSEAEQTSAAATLFGKEATAGMLALINSAPEDIAKLNTAINESKDCAQNMADTMNDNLNGQVTVLKSQLQELAISMGEILIPIIRAVVSKIQEVVDWLNHLTPGQRELILVIAAVTACIGPLLIAVGNVITALGSIMTLAPTVASLIKGIGTAITGLGTIMAANPIGLIVVAVTALIAVLVSAYTHSEKFRDIVNKAFTAVKETIEKILGAIVEIFKFTWNSIVKTWTEAGKFFKQIADAIGTVFSVIPKVLIDLFKNAWEGIAKIWDASVTLTFFKKIFDGIKNAFSKTADVFGDFFKKAWTNIKNAFSPWETFFNGMWNGIKRIFGSVGSFFKETFQKAWNNVKNVFSEWGSFFGNLWTIISNKFTSIGTHIGEAISNSVKAGINGIISSIENVVNTGINMVNGAISLINLIPGVTLDYLSGMSLPRLAQGGVVQKPTVAEIGENGAEAIVPLKNNTEWIDNVADRLSKRSGEENKVAMLVVERIDKLEKAIKSLNPKVVLDSGEVVGGIITQVDTGLGDLDDRANRGW